MARFHCDIGIHPEDVAFMKQAMATPGLVPDSIDLILGDTQATDGVRADIRLCGMDPTEPAQLCAAIFTKEDLLDYIHADDYEETFVLAYGQDEYVVSFHEDPAAAIAHVALNKQESDGPCGNHL